MEIVEIRAGANGRHLPAQIETPPSQHVILSQLLRFRLFPTTLSPPDEIH